MTVPAMNPIVEFFQAKAPKGTAVLAGEFAATAPFPHFAAAFRAEGWDVAEVDHRSYMSMPGNRWVNRITDRLLPAAKSRSLGAAIEKSVSNSGAELVLFAKGVGANRDLLARLSARGCRTVCWYPDRDFDHANVYPEAFADFDLFVTTKVHQLQYLRAIRRERPTVLIEHGWSPGVHWRLDPPMAPADRPFDLIFIGNFSPYKQKWLEDLVELIPDIRLAVAGHGWPECGAKFPTHVAVGGALIGDSMSRAIGHARIAIAVHHGPGGRHGWQDDVSARTFEIPACGTFMLHIDNPHVRTLFDVPGEIDVFATADELAAKVTHYLANPDEREAAAARAYSRAVPAYSYFEAGRAISNAIQHELGAKD
jgi:spore maturation protein CgeB